MQVKRFLSVYIRYLSDKCNSVLGEVGAECSRVGLEGNSGILSAIQLEKEKKSIKSTFCFSIWIA